MTNNTALIEALEIARNRFELRADLCHARKAETSAREWKRFIGATFDALEKDFHQALADASIGGAGELDFDALKETLRQMFYFGVHHENAEIAASESVRVFREALGADAPRGERPANCRQRLVDERKPYPPPTIRERDR